MGLAIFMFKKRGTCAKSTHNANEAQTTDIELTRNDAYEVIEKKDAIILNDNVAYESAAANGTCCDQSVGRYK